MIWYTVTASNWKGFFSLGMKWKHLMWFWIWCKCWIKSCFSKHCTNTHSIKLPLKSIENKQKRMCRCFSVFHVVKFSHAEISTVFKNISICMHAIDRWRSNTFVDVLRWKKKKNTFSYFSIPNVNFIKAVCRKQICSTWETY